MSDLQENEGLIFIPDISGFTKFVNDTEINHAGHIISELLEVILKTNQINLSVSEIEGDAVLFYRPGEAPSPQDLYGQAKNMFIEFQRYIRQIEQDRICECGACSTAINLTLKFVAHHGELSISQIREHAKLMGKSVIIAHRLLKNNIEGREYLLMTEAVAGDTAINNKEIPELINGEVSFDHIGKIDYKYVILSPLREHIPDPEPPVKPVKMKDPIVATEVINVPMSVIYSTILDINLRPQWTDGLKSISHDEEEIPRIGSKHICEVATGSLEIETIRKNLQEGRIEYVEKATNAILFRDSTSIYTLQDNGSATNLRLEFHYHRYPLLSFIIDKFLRNKLEASIRKSAENLRLLCEKIYAGDHTTAKAIM